MYPRKQYMDKLIAKKDNGRVKVITGLRRSGKSVLLFDLYRKYLLQDGIFIIDIDFLSYASTILFLH